MTLWTRFRILARGLASRWLARATRPEYVLEYTVERLEQASHQIKVHLAELIVVKQRSERQLLELQGQVAPSPELRMVLESQLSAQDERIRALRLHLADLDSKLLALRARKADLGVRANLLEAQEEIQKVLKDMNVTRIEDVLAGIQDDLSHREEVQRVLDQLDGRNALPRLP